MAGIQLCGVRFQERDLPNFIFDRRVDGIRSSKTGLSTRRSLCVTRRNPSWARKCLGKNAEAAGSVQVLAGDDNQLEHQALDMGDTENADPTLPVLSLATETVDSVVKENSVAHYDAEDKTANGNPAASNDEKKENVKGGQKIKSKEFPEDKFEVQKPIAKEKEVKKDTGLGLYFKKDENFEDWYSEVVLKGEMIECYDVSGCYILRPWAYSIWELLTEFFDAEIKKMGVKNSYFPLFLSENVSTILKHHMDSFKLELAWVSKTGETDLEIPIAIRPTSEAVMYPLFSKWIRSHRDLPLKLNQWCNVVRWESKHPTPFIRSCEFLWQEGHSAFATREEADEEVLAILELYRKIYEEFLAVPVIMGKKSKAEKFACDLYTTTVEAFVPNTGRGIQGATSHCLGQNYANMFEIIFENEKGERDMVWQNSWGYSTRTIGVMVMIHGDNKGLVLPPRVAPLQIVVVPVPYKDADTCGILDACIETVQTLRKAGFRIEEDLGDNYSPGWKYSHWELKGVPLRIEIGPKDLAKDQVRVVRRDNFAKEDVPLDHLTKRVGELLEEIQSNLFERAKLKRDSCIKKANNWDEFMCALNDKMMVLAPWCDETDVEEDVKARTEGETGAAKTLCMPFDHPDLPEGAVCFASGKPAKKWALWGRSY